MDITLACMQIEVTKFSNVNKITDFLTEQDEIALRFGINKIVAYQYLNFFNANQVIEVPKGKATFPCFKDYDFYLLVQEYDEKEHDTATQVAIKCQDLQEGTNEVQIHLTEQASGLEEVYNVIKDTKVAKFKFFDDTLKDQATYIIELEVSDVCEEEFELLDTKISGPPGLLEMRSIDEAELIEHIEKKEF